MFRSRSVRWQIAILTLIPLVLGLIVGAITLPGSTTHAGPGSGINLNPVSRRLPVNGIRAASGS